ncbi:TIM barrel protein [Devosia sp. FKR38]|uniref:sugar phosphate isomerase/epimerase family protein n=1 Tax=Devosia sp. FKR38 TaxID=2562312 RepID=UPI0010C10F00|nr:TIM barrel protein [Devosia sp. FKR38]
MTLITCFSTLGCPQLSLRQAIALAQANDLPMLEIRALSGSTALPSVLAAEFGTPTQLTAYLAGVPLSIPVVGSSHRLWGDTFDRDSLEDLADWAEAAGARHIRVFDGETGTLDESALDEAARRLQFWRDLKVSKGLVVDLIIETHGALCDDQALEQFCTRFADQPILWDTHHSWAAGNALEHTLEIIGPRLAHLHVKDSRMVDGKRHYMLPGQGDFPMDRLMALLARPSLPAAAVSLEWELLWHPELTDLQTALGHARSWT